MDDEKCPGCDWTAEQREAHERARDDASEAAYGQARAAAVRCPASLRGNQCYLDRGHRGMHTTDERGVRWTDLASDGQVTEAPHDSTTALERTLAVALYSAGFEAGVWGEPPQDDRGGHFRRGHRDGVNAVQLARKMYREKLEAMVIDMDGRDR